MMNRFMEYYYSSLNRRPIRGKPRNRKGNSGSNIHSKSSSHNNNKSILKNSIDSKNSNKFKLKNKSDDLEIHRVHEVKDNDNDNNESNDNNNNNNNNNSTSTTATTTNTKSSESPVPTESNPQLDKVIKMLSSELSSNWELQRGAKRLRNAPPLSYSENTPRRMEATPSRIGQGPLPTPLTTAERIEMERKKRREREHEKEKGISSLTTAERIEIERRKRRDREKEKGKDGSSQTTAERVDLETKRRRERERERERERDSKRKHSKHSSTHSKHSKHRSSKDEHKSRDRDCGRDRGRDSHRSSSHSKTHSSHSRSSKSLRSSRSSENKENEILSKEKDKNKNKPDQEEIGEEVAEAEAGDEDEESEEESSEEEREDPKVEQLEKVKNLFQETKVNMRQPLQTFNKTYPMDYALLVNPDANEDYNKSQIDNIDSIDHINRLQSFIAQEFKTLSTGLSLARIPRTERLIDLIDDTVDVLSSDYAELKEKVKNKLPEINEEYSIEPRLYPSRINTILNLKIPDIKIPLFQESFQNLTEKYKKRQEIIEKRTSYMLELADKEKELDDKVKHKQKLMAVKENREAMRAQILRDLQQLESDYVQHLSKPTITPINPNDKGNNGNNGNKNYSNLIVGPVASTPGTQDRLSDLCDVIEALGDRTEK